MQKKYKSSVIKARCLFLLIILVILVSICEICIHFLTDNSKYIPINRRNNYILYQVDENYLKPYLKKNTLVVFWASWCQQCVEDTNIITDFSKNNPNIPVIIVSHDTNYQELEEYLKSNNLPWFVIFDSDKKIRMNIDKNSSGIPSIYLVDNNSNVINKLVYPFTYDDILNFYYN